MNRPFIGVSLAFAAGIALGCMAPPYLTAVPAAIFIVFALSVAALTLNRWWRAAALALLLLGGAAHFQEREAAGVPFQLLDIVASKPGLHQVRGVISSDPSPLPFSDFYDKKIQYRSSFILAVKEIREGTRWVGTSGRIRVTLKTRESPDLNYGDYIRIEGKTYRPYPPTNPGQFDFRRYLERRSIYLGCSVRDEEHLKVISHHRGNRVVELALRLRKRLCEKLETGMPDTPASRLLPAILLGYREGVSDQLVQYFRRTNTVHILAISGLHVGLIYLLIRTFFKAFLLPRWAVSLLAIPLLLLYMLLTGMKVPVMRATLMIVVYLLAPFFRRQADLLNTVGLAAFLILLVAPAQLFAAGFQLSFVAVISIIVFTPFLEGLLFRLFRLDVLPGQLYAGPMGGWPARSGRLVLASVAVSLAACAGLWPLIAYYFNIVSPITVVANIVVAFILTAAIGIGFLSAVLGFIWGAFSFCLNRLNYWILEAMICWVKFMASIPFAYFHVRTPSPLEMGGYYALLLLFARGRRLNSKRVLACLGAALAVAIILFAGIGEGGKCLEIAFLDIGQGDSAFLRLPNGATLLVDGGPRTNFDSGKYIVLPFLRSLGIKAIDVVIATHADMDHIGGLVSVIGDMKVKRVIMPHGRHTTWTQCRLLEMIDERGIALQLGRRGERIDVCPGVWIDILHPTEEWVGKEGVSENDRSVVIRLVYGSTSAILTGDIGGASEEEMTRNVSGIRSDVLKVSHHGAKSGTSKAFLWAVRPRIAVISAGRDNRYGHPAPEVVERLISMGARVYRTDRDGAVFLKSDGSSWECSVFRREPVASLVAAPACPE